MTQQMIREKTCISSSPYFCLEQRNHFPTNLYADQLKSCLNLVSTNMPPTHTRSLQPLGNSDHLSLSIYRRVTYASSKYDVAESRRQVWCWSKANQQELKAAVASVNWTDVLNSEDVNQAWQTWKTRLLEIADRHIPKLLVPTDSPRSRPWMNCTNGRLKQAIRAGEASPLSNL